MGARPPDTAPLAAALAACRAADPGLAVGCVPAEPPERVWTAEFQTHVLALLNGLPHGVYAMDPQFPGVVGASANLGVVRRQGAELEVRLFLRCARAEDEAALSARCAALGAEHGFAGRWSGYPGWPGRRDNPLARVLERVWREQTGGTLELTAVHVGLEPSVFLAKAPGLVMASTGPDIMDAHSVHERAPLAGLADYALLLAGAMEAL